jgi:hypothetical protein
MMIVVKEKGMGGWEPWYVVVEGDSYRTGWSHERRLRDILARKVETMKPGQRLWVTRRMGIITQTFICADNPKRLIRHKNNSS